MRKILLSLLIMFSFVLVSCQEITDDYNKAKEPSIELKVEGELTQVYEENEDLEDVSFEIVFKQFTENNINMEDVEINWFIRNQLIEEHSNKTNITQIVNSPGDINVRVEVKFVFEERAKTLEADSLIRVIKAATNILVTNSIDDANHRISVKLGDNNEVEFTGRITGNLKHSVIKWVIQKETSGEPEIYREFEVDDLENVGGIGITNFTYKFEEPGSYIVFLQTGGGISGKIESELFLEYGSVVNYDYKYVTEFTGTFIKTANYSTFPVSLKVTRLDIDKFNNNVTIYRALNENNEDSLYLTETLLDWNNNPLVNAEVEIYHEEIGLMIKTTDENGKVVFEVPFNNNWEFKEKVTYKLTVKYENVTYSYPYVFENVPLIVDVSNNEFNVENTASSIDFYITIIETFTGNPLVNHEINLEIKDSLKWLRISNYVPIKTDQEGKVKITISIDGNGEDEDARSAVVNIKINYDGFDEILKVNISQKEGESSGGSPYIYSTDKNGNLNLENGPISLSVLKTIESSSYGTLKLLESIDGKYYIQVIEDGTSTTMFNSANLYAVDYLDDGFVLGVLYDIYGEPHTIKEKILPNSFVDENGTSYLDKISQMDEVFATLPYSANQLSHFYLTFDKNTLYNNAKFVISIRNNGSLLSTLESMGNINIDGFSDLWLLDALLMSDPNNIEIVNNIVKAFEIKVQVWNGFAWVTQGTLQPSSKLTEEFLIPIDLTGTSNEIKIRIEMPTQSGYGIDSVYMDFSENMPMIKRELIPISALTQDGIDVLDIITISNDEYVKLLAYEYVMLEYETPELLEGYSRGYGFKMEGYAYKGLDLKTEDDILEQFIGLDFNQILDVVYNSEREDLLEHIEMIAEFAQTLIYMGTLEEEELIELFLYLGNSN